MNNNTVSGFRWPAWLLAIVMATVLSACGSSALQLVDGIGGTGITTVGRITSFGSVHVNGIHFDTGNAVFTRDGNTVTAQQDFHVGEIVKVIGIVNADGKTGTATEVIYSDVLEGPVTAVASGNTLTIMEQRVVAGQLTLLHGFNKLSELALGNIVEVSGFINDGGEIEATSINLIQEGFTTGSVLEVEGEISVVDTVGKTFRIGGLTVDYSLAMLDGISEAGLADGVYLTVRTDQDIGGGVMLASEVTFFEDRLEPGVAYDIEGLVSRFVSTVDFDIEGYSVVTNAQTVYRNGAAADLKLDAQALVSGTVNQQGVLIAEEISLFELSTEVVLEASLEAVDTLNSTVTLLGQTVAVDTFTLLSDETTDDFVFLDLDQFTVGEAVFVVAYRRDDGRVVATRLSRIPAIPSLYLSAVVNSPDAASGTLTLFGSTIMTDAGTVYLDADLNEIDQADFFTQLADGITVVDMTGNSFSAGFIRADDLMILK